VHYPTGPGPNDRGNSRLHVLRACEASLARLGMDHIDLYQTHRPDFDVPLEETLGALDDLVRQGKVRYVGSSTAPAWHVMEALSISQRDRRVAFTSEQSPYNLLDRRIENELVPMCLRHQIGILAWSPLAMGMLAGRYPPGTGVPSDSRAAVRGGIYAQRVTPAGVSAGHVFTELARARGFEPALLAALWVKDQPGITAPIIGPRTEQQLTELVTVGDMTLDPEAAAACDALVAPGSVVSSFFNSAEWMRLRVT
jgi:aryl-alcohol dehydrogenase-like predicted oxidoreductase